MIPNFLDTPYCIFNRALFSHYYVTLFSEKLLHVCIITSIRYLWDKQLISFAKKLQFVIFKDLEIPFFSQNLKFCSCSAILTPTFLIINVWFELKYNLWMYRSEHCLPCQGYHEGCIVLNSILLRHRRLGLKSPSSTITLLKWCQVQGRNRVRYNSLTQQNFSKQLWDWDGIGKPVPGTGNVHMVGQVKNRSIIECNPADVSNT